MFLSKKTYRLTSSAHQACLIEFTAKYYRLPRLWYELKIAKANGTYANWLSQVAKIDVLLLDDWDLASPEENLNNFSNFTE